MSPDAERSAPPLRIGVDASNLLTDRRGIGRYVRALLRRWIEHDATRVDVTLLVSHPLPALVARQLAADLGLPRIAVGRRSRLRTQRFDIANAQIVLSAQGK